VIFKPTGASEDGNNPKKVVEEVQPTAAEQQEHDGGHHELGEGEVAVDRHFVGSRAANSEQKEKQTHERTIKGEVRCGVVAGQDRFFA
jgi:hypothetical protein